MKYSEFIIECNKNYVDVNIALENENIIKALKERDDEKVVDILIEEF